MHLLTCINANNMIFMLGKIQFIEFILSILFINNFLMNNEANIIFVVLYGKYFGLINWLHKIEKFLKIQELLCSINQHI